MSIIKHTVSTHSIVLYHQGKTYSVVSNHPNYKLVMRMLENNKQGKATPEDVIRATKHEGITDWINSYSSVVPNSKPIKFENGVFYFGDKALPSTIANRIRALAQEGLDPSPILRFCERFLKNPSQRSIDQLWSFLDRSGIPLDDDGCFLAYKAVSHNLYDCYSGTILNSIGSTIKMDRALVNDDPNAHCHVGLHVGALEYVVKFGPRILIVKVDPMNVVSVPNNCDCMKMRVCEYKVIGHYLEQMSSTVQSTQKVVDNSVNKETGNDNEEDEDQDDDNWDEDDTDDDVSFSESSNVLSITVGEPSPNGIVVVDSGATPDVVSRVRKEFDLAIGDLAKNGPQPSSKSPVPFSTAEELSSLSIKELFELDRDQLNMVAAFYEIVFTADSTPASLIMKINELRSYT